MKKFAEFYKCALQVNPYSYIAYRGTEHEVDEEKYNQLILGYCLSEDIKVVGLADHGSIETTENLRKLLVDNGIVVFPGFEIATAEKIHIVCLFSEDTTPEQLNRYLGRLGLTDIENGVNPSNFSCLEIAKLIEELSGFWYAAHITSDNGILKMGQMNHIWTDPRLKAAQIPHNFSDVDSRFINIIKNKEPMYRKETPFAFINAKDISKPEDLLEKNAYCLVKMSEVKFSCFKDAFQDPSARVKLSYELNERFHSSIDQIEVYGGYLDGLSIELSRNLNTAIGGRGTGKSTLIELIRYALDLEPKSSEAKKYFKELVKSNLGYDGGRVELKVTSHKQFGQKYKIIKRFGAPALVENEDGTNSSLTVSDILQHIEIYGQNEIMELISNEEAKLEILSRFLPNQELIYIERSEIIKSLRQNALKLIEKVQRKEDCSEKISKLPVLEEKIKFFKETGIADKLSAIEYLSTEEEHIKKSIEIFSQHSLNISELNVPFTKDFAQSTQNNDIFMSILELTDYFNNEIKKLKGQYSLLVKDTIDNINGLNTEWMKKKIESENEINKAIKTLGNFNGKTGPEIAVEYKETISEIARITPEKEEVSRLEDDLDKIISERHSLLENLRKNNDKSNDELRKAVKKINKGNLRGRVQVEVYAGRNREELIKLLSDVEGLGAKSLQWIREIDEFSIFSFVQHLKQGSEKLQGEYGLTKSRADILAQLPLEKILEIELVQLLDIIDVKLNVKNESSKEDNFKSLNRLSKGQQCTAILNILMLDNHDPLIIDQPEDNLDNSYIANNFVDGLRDYKLNRQFVFATHNPNIPVFGDSELIMVMEEIDGQGIIEDNCIGSVDNPNVKSAVVNTLEGGQTAFQMRRAKYNL